MLSSTGIRRFAGVLMAGAFTFLTTGVLGDSAVTPGSKAAGMEACVAPTAEMRRNHMDYLKHDRIKTVRKGIRDIRNSLADCVDCHAAKNGSGGYAQIDSEGQFCDKCHNYMAVDLACFQCHRKTPGEEKLSQSALDGGNVDHRLGLLRDKDAPAALAADELVQLQAIVQED
ncbi:MAG: sulfur reduction protein DsrJ [Gammaproteobacteria bacterium]|nr:sulfur reduction protein DsrJ [Gammaproteobacteria bacterium]